MQSRSLAAVVAVVGVVVAVVLFVVLSGGDDSDSDQTTTQASPSTTTKAGSEPQGAAQSTTGEPKPEPEPEPDVQTIVVEGGEPVGGVQELSFDKGGSIRFAVESDVADEVHLHGYDVAEEVGAGETVQFDVPATIDGVFEVELEERVVPLAEITVNP